MNPADHFETIASELYEPLFRFAMSLARDKSDAQDLTQQSYYVWAIKGHQLRDASKVRTWMFSTLHRAFLESRRRRTRFPHDSFEEVSDQLPELSSDAAEPTDTSLVLPALARVHEAYKAAVELFYLKSYSHNAIAEILEIPVGTVKSRIARGIAQLREILSPDGLRGGVPDGVEMYLSVRQMGH